MVASAVGAVLLTALQNIFFKGTSLLEKSHSTLEATAGAQLLLERVHADVRRIVAGDPFPSMGVGPPASFQVVTATGGVETITYDLAAGPSSGTYYVVRNGRRLWGVVVKSFSMTGEIPMLQNGAPLYGIRTSLIATDGQGKAEFPLIDFTAVDMETRRSSDPYWVSNPDP
jgi:hypothetical protein